MRRNLILLAACQALMLTGAVVLASTAVLVGSHLTSNQSMSTIPLAVFNIGVMVTALPASMLMKRIGRRWGFALGGTVGVFGAAVATLGVVRVDFVQFCAGMAVLGAYMAFGGYYRFAAVELSPPEYSSRAIGWVTGGGVIAAFAGTGFSVLTQNVRGLGEFSASYMVLGGTAAITILFALLLKAPTPTREECARCGRPLLTIARQPEYFVAVISAALGYFVMALIMNSTPLAMRAYAFTFGVTAFVIQWHVVAMFAPSFASGPLIARIGVERVLMFGTALMSACVIISLLGTGEEYFWFALAALGVGWNFLFIGGTTLLTRTYTPEERAKSQGLNDLIVYAAIAVAGLAAGEVYSLLGWHAINLAAVPAVLVIAGAVAWLALRRGEHG
jgi:predicted MFS family arabinose efflux permease